MSGSHQDMVTGQAPWKANSEPGSLLRVRVTGLGRGRSGAVMKSPMKVVVVMDSKYIK